MPGSYARLKAWQNARRLAVDCAAASRRLPSFEQGALGLRLRQAAYAVVSAVAAGGVATGPERIREFSAACRALAEAEALVTVAHDLGYWGSRDFAKLEAWCAETMKTVRGLTRTLAAASPPAA